MDELRNKFQDADMRLFDGYPDEWVNLARLNEVYRNHVHKGTQMMLIKKYKLEHRVVIRRGEGTGKVLDLVLVDVHEVENPDFKPATMAVYVKLRDVFNTDALRSMMLNPRKTKKRGEGNSRNVIARLTEDSDVRTITPDQRETTETIAFRSIADLEPVISEYPLVQLEQHELFRNADGNAVDVEVRGERSMEKILFKAKDIGAFFGMTNLVKVLTRSTDSQYHETTDYVMVRPSLNKNIDWDAVFLTYHGFIRVIFVSTSGNENRSRMVEWSLRILYTHQLGSDEERCDVASDLLRFILNLKLCGLYFIDFGKVSDLYESMPISKTEYPLESYGPYRVGKLGYSEEFPDRLKKLTSEYSQYSQTIRFRWMLLVPKSQLRLAEDRLKELVNEYELKLHFKKYRELVIYDPVREHELKHIYNRIGDEFPCFDFDKKLKELELIAEAKFTKKEIEYLTEIRQLNDAHVKEVAELKSAYAELKDAHTKEVIKMKDAHSKERASNSNKIHEMELQMLRKDMEIQTLHHRDQLRHDGGL